MREDDRFVHFLIVNFNGSEVLDECLQSILSQDYGKMEILVVDNYSTDQSRHVIRQYAPKVTLLGLDRNYGYAKASNIGLTHILEKDAGYIAFANTDVVLSPNWTEALIHFMSCHGFDFAQSIITTYGSDDVVDSLGIGISRHLSVYDRGRGSPLSNIHPSSSAILGPCFAASLFRREVIDRVRVGPRFFDERFHSFYEDVDCCFRANFFGFRGGLLLEPLCRHRRSFTADQFPFRKYFLLGKNHWLLLWKHVPSKWIAKKCPRILFRQSLLLLRSGRSARQFVGFLIGSSLGIIGLLKRVFHIDQGVREVYPNKEEIFLHILEGHYE